MQPSSYYDALFRNPEALYALPPEEQPWHVLWHHIARRFRIGETVIDAGCGQGHLCGYLPPDVIYSGYDFSEEAIEQAKRRYGVDWFNLEDITEGLPDWGDLYVFCEVLEHIERDLDVLAKVPSGRRVIITVPRHDDPSHVRRFKKLPQAIKRYQEFFDIFCAFTIQNRWHLIEGIKL